MLGTFDSPVRMLKLFDSQARILELFHVNSLNMRSKLSNDSHMRTEVSNDSSMRTGVFHVYFVLNIEYIWYRILNKISIEYCYKWAAIPGAKKGFS